MSSLKRNYAKHGLISSYTDEVKLQNQTKRADRWAKKYKNDLKHYDAVLVENEQLKKTNSELNLMHHEAIVKVIYLGKQLRKEG